MNKHIFLISLLFSLSYSLTINKVNNIYKKTFKNSLQKELYTLKKFTNNTPIGKFKIVTSGNAWYNYPLPFIGPYFAFSVRSFSGWNYDAKYGVKAIAIEKNYHLLSVNFDNYNIIEKLDIVKAKKDVNYIKETAKNNAKKFLNFTCLKLYYKVYRDCDPDLIRIRNILYYPSYKRYNKYCKNKN